MWAYSKPQAFTLTGIEGYRTLALPYDDLSLGGRIPGYLASLYTAGYKGADRDQNNRRGLATVLLYDEATGAYEPPSRHDAVEPGQGMWVYVRRDDDDRTPGVQGTFPKVLDVSGGTAVTGEFAFDLSYTDSAPAPGLNLVGNPYPEAIIWGDLGWTRGDIASTVYVYDPRYNGGNFRAWNGFSGDLEGGVIAAGQGFHVEALSETAELRVRESAKSGSTGALSGLTASGETGKAASGARGLAFRLTGTVGGHTRESRAWVSLSPASALGLDALDGRRLAGASGADALRLYALVPEGHAGGGDALAITSLPESLSGTVEIPLHAEALASGAPADARATLAWDAASLPAGWSATLVDRASGERHALSASGELDLRLVPEAALTHTPADFAPEAKTGGLPPVPQARPLRVAANKTSGARFTLVLTPAGGASPEASAFVLGEAHPNPSSGEARIAVTLAEAGEVSLSVYDALGRRVVVSRELLAAGAHRVAVPVSDLAPGTYVVRVVAPGGAATRRMTVAR